LEESATKCFAASKPRPVFAPVTMKVAPLQPSGVGARGRGLRWSWTNSEKVIVEIAM
jgi:hypothetical protein